jgi:hypothetical protein
MEFLQFFEAANSGDVVMLRELLESQHHGVDLQNEVR